LQLSSKDSFATFTQHETKMAAKDGPLAKALEYLDLGLEPRAS